MLIEAYPQAHRQRIEELLKTIDNLPFTKIKKCKIFKVNDPYNKYAKIVICGTSYVVSRLVLERKINRRLKYKELALHNCDHPRCVCEDHLYVGSSLINSDDVRIKNGNFALQDKVEGRLRENEAFTYFYDEFGKKHLEKKEIEPVIKKPLRFFDNQVVEIISGNLTKQLAKTTCDVPMTYNINSKIEICINKTGSRFWVKIKDLKPIT